MRIPIKVKIVVLGALLSALVTVTAIVFTSLEYHKRGERELLNRIDNWFSDLNEDYTDSQTAEENINQINEMRSYVLEQYAEHPDDPDESLSIQDKKNFYRNRFTWLYPIEGIGMYHMTDEERTFRQNFEELYISIYDTKYATSAQAVYVAFVLDNTLFYICDEYAFTKNVPEVVHFQGSREYNFQGQFKKSGNYLSLNYNGKTNKVLPVYSGETAIAYFFVEYNFNRVDQESRSLTTNILIVLSVATVVMLIAYTLGAHFLFLKNVSRLTKTTSEFTEDLSKGKTLEKKDPKIKSNDEIRDLSSSFVALEEGIIKYIDIIQQETKERERTNAELSVATNIQLGALPNNRFDNNETSIRAFIKSAKEVGGDFYDYFYLDDNRMAIIISDVSGKGIPAALFMMKSKELIKSCVRTHKSLVNAVKEVNTMLTTNNPQLLFVTSFIGIIDFKNHKITYVNAGHEKPYIISKDGVRKVDGNSNFVMGGEEDFEYVEESTSFNKGESLFLFTDGLNESINDKNEEFSYQRIEETLNNNRESIPEDIISSMNKNLEEFVGDKEQFDDVTMVVVNFRDNELTLSYNEKDYKIITDIVDNFNKKFSFLNDEVKSKCGIVVDELVNNLISYEKREDLVIDASFKVDKDELIISIKCNGDDYDPFGNHKEKYLENFHPEIAEGGFGLSIIKDFAKEYSYKYVNKHSITTIVLAI